MIGAILTAGLGSFGSVNLLPTLGYLSGESTGTAEVFSGGFPSRGKKDAHLPWKGHPWIDGPTRRYIEEVEPEIVEAVIEAVAEAVEKQPVQGVPDTASAEKALRNLLRQQQSEWKDLYAQLIRLEYERRWQDEDDKQILLLLMEM